VATTARGICRVSLGSDAQELEAGLAAEFPAAELRRDRGALNAAVAVLLRYLDGRAEPLDLPLDVRATAFQRRVWEALRRIPTAPPALTPRSRGPSPSRPPLAPWRAPVPPTRGARHPLPPGRAGRRWARRVPLGGRAQACTVGTGASGHDQLGMRGLVARLRGNVYVPAMALSSPAFRAVATCVVPEAVRLDAAQWDEMEAIVARAIAARSRSVQRQLTLFLILLEWLPLLRYARRLSRLDPARRANFPRPAAARSPAAPEARVLGVRTLILMGYYGRPAAATDIGYRADAGGWEVRR